MPINSSLPAPGHSGLPFCFLPLQIGDDGPSSGAHSRCSTNTGWTSVPRAVPTCTKSRKDTFAPDSLSTCSVHLHGRSLRGDHARGVGGSRGARRSRKRAVRAELGGDRTQEHPSHLPRPPPSGPAERGPQLRFYETPTVPQASFTLPAHPTPVGQRPAPSSPFPGWEKRAQRS